MLTVIDKLEPLSSVPFRGHERPVQQHRECFQTLEPSLGILTPVTEKDNDKKEKKWEGGNKNKVDLWADVRFNTWEDLGPEIFEFIFCAVQFYFSCLWLTDIIFSF